MNDEYLVYNEELKCYELDPEQAVRDDVEKNRWKLNWQLIVKDWRLYVMLIPMILVFLFWRYLPMYELLGCFKITEVGKKVAEMKWCGFANFKLLMFGTSTQTSAFFNEIKSDILRSIYQVLTYLPKFMSTVVMTTLVTMLLKQGDLVSGTGIVSLALAKLGIISREAADAGLLNNPNYFRAIYQISGIWEGAGYDSIVYFAAIIAVSPTSYEAAQIDGAGKMAQMRYVVIPCILSTVVIMLINRIGSLLSIGYEKVMLLYRANTFVTADVVSTFAYRLGLEGGSQAIASAAEMINNITGMILVIGANSIARKASDVSLY